MHTSLLDLSTMHYFDFCLTLQQWVCHSITLAGFCFYWLIFVNLFFSSIINHFCLLLGCLKILLASLYPHLVAKCFGPGRRISVLKGHKAAGFYGLQGRIRARGNPALSTWVAQKYHLDSGLNLNKPQSQKTEAKWLEHKRHKYCNRKHINHKDSFSYKAQYYEKKVELLL